MRRQRFILQLEVRLACHEGGDGIGQEGHCIPDDAGGHPPALAAKDCDVSVAQVRKVGLDQPRRTDHPTALCSMPRLFRANSGVPRSSRSLAMPRSHQLASTRLLRGLEKQAVLAQRDQEPQLFQVELADDRVEWSGVERRGGVGSCLGCVNVIATSHLVSCRTERELQHFEHCVPLGHYDET